MIDAAGPTMSGSSREIALGSAAHRETDASSRPHVDDRAKPGEGRSNSRPDVRLRRIAAEIIRSVQARLPGRVRDLAVRIEQDQFVLSGVATSYYVKQVAQHVAMNALDALMLGRLVNEIEVRSVR